MDIKRPLIFGLITVFFYCGCRKSPVNVNHGGGGDTVVTQKGPPNIIFFVANDMGYEMPTFDGGGSYNTSHLDSLAANGMVFDQCWATPNSSPSRVELLSGVYNFQNYLTWGWGNYNPLYVSIAQSLQYKGYKTSVVGAWDLNNANVGINIVGFNDHCVWGETTLFSGFLYKNPDLYENGLVLPSAATQGKYSEDIISQHAMNFIDSNKNKPFFIYYSFLLVHKPFQPTPLDASFSSFNAPSPTFDDTYSDTSYIASMTHYLDLKVGAIVSKIKKLGLEKNTIIVFTSTNGSAPGYHSLFNGKQVMGEKGQTTKLGTHVPLLVYWPGHIAPGSKSHNLVDFTDFYPSFVDMATSLNKPPGLPGISFYPQLFGFSGSARSWTYCYYDPYPVINPYIPENTTTPVSYAQDKEYKLYKTGNKAGNFYHFTVDPEEVQPIQDSQLTATEVSVKQKLKTALNGLQ